jgi:hypothetical protein
MIRRALRTADIPAQRLVVCPALAHRAISLECRIWSLLEVRGHRAALAPEGSVALSRNRMDV